MTPNPNPSPELLSRAREILAQAYERADLICPAADVRSGNKIDWVREKVALDAVLAALSQTLPAPGEVGARAAHIAAYSGPVVSFDVTAPYYLASCDSCGWVGSSELCGTDTGCDDSNVYCPRCDASGADCGKIATQSPPWTVATVAAANDGGVEALREPIARLVKPDNWHWHDRFMREADEAKFDGQANHKREEAARQVDTSLAVADQIIRLLSQGGGK